MRTSLTRLYKLRCSQYVDGQLTGNHYMVAITVSNSIDPLSGLIIDRDLMDQIIKEHIIDKYDKTNLNNLMEWSTGESFAKTIFEQIMETKLKNNLVEVSLQKNNDIRFSYSGANSHT